MKKNHKLKRPLSDAEIEKLKKANREKFPALADAVDMFSEVFGAVRVTKIVGDWGYNDDDSRVSKNGDAATEKDDE